MESSQIVNELQEKLQKFNIKKIDTLEELKKVIDFKDSKPVEPIVIEEGLSMLMLDNVNYNETYLIDVFEKFYEKHKEELQELKMKFFYVDSLELKSYIIRMGEIVPIQDPEYLEKNVLVPSIFVINKSNNDIGVLRESKISVLDESDFEDSLKYITKKK